MSITHPTPVGPFSLTLDTDATEQLAPAAEPRLDGLPLLDHRLRNRTIPPAVALRGHYLALDDGADTRLLRLDQDVIHIGRGASADVRFDEHRVSRDHAILVRHGRHWRLLDNRSANGTFVNGRRITATNLSSGDVIELGPVLAQLVEVQ
jgi:FHA domain